MKNKISLLIGLFIITFILYNRLFRIRLPKNFSDIVNSPYYYIYFLIIIGFLIMLFITLFQLYKAPFYIQEKSTGFINQLLQNIKNHTYNPVRIIFESMISLDAFIKNKIPLYNDNSSYSDFIIMKCAHLLFDTKIKRISMLLLFRIIPQLIVCTCFFYDILLTNKFNYFYKSLILLILPLLLQYIIYSITTFIETNLEGLNNALDLRILPSRLYSQEVPLEYYQIISIFEWRDLLLTPQKEDYICYNNLLQPVLDEFNGDVISAKASLENAINLMNALFIINKFIHSYSHYKIIMEPPIKIVKYTLYIIGWSYIVFGIGHL